MSSSADAVLLDLAAAPLEAALVLGTTSSPRPSNKLSSSSLAEAGFDFLGAMSVLELGLKETRCCAVGRYQMEVIMSYGRAAVRVQRYVCMM
jgi:hypothetical protein